MIQIDDNIITYCSNLLRNTIKQFPFVHTFDFRKNYPVIL